MSKREVVVGDILHWFQGGRPEVPPFAAMVLVIQPGGEMLTLEVTNQDGQKSIAKNVWPVGHQTLVDNHLIASRCGAWKHRREEPPQVEQAPFSAQPEGDVQKPELKQKANSKA